MWLRAARHRVFARGMGALLALIVCTSAFDWGHHGGDDPDCSAAIVLHDHAAHRFRTAPADPSQPPEHCYICHSLRLLHAALGATAVAADADLRASRFSFGQHLSARTLTSQSAVSRAPPTVLL